jgi:phage terminase large subunit
MTAAARKVDDEYVVDAAIPAAYSVLFQPARYKVLYGGRGKGASWSFARALLVKGATQNIRILCTRELQKSIKDSVHRLLEDQINELGLQDIYKVTQSEVTSRVTDTSFIFKGLRYNVEEIKSTEGIDICWVAEAEKCSDNSWKVLIPTIRKEDSEIWVDFNPNLETDPTYQRFVKSKPPNSIVHKLSYRDNPFFPQVLREEMEYDRRVDPEGAAHVWDGELANTSEAAIFKGKWTIDTFEPGPDWSGPYHGADWGFSIDPTVLIKCWVHARTLYIEYEAWALHCELDSIPDLFDKVPLARNYKIMADSARPETISHVSKKNFKIEGAEKYSGSVEEGITFLKSFERIVIHERCKHMITEAKLYSYKVDRLTGEPTTVIEDRNNHCWDAIRYALQKMIMLSKRGGRPSIRSLS